MMKRWSIGNSADITVRRETYQHEIFSPISMLYLSDFHFNANSQKSGRRISEIVHAEQPDLLILGGDYADSKQGLLYFEEMLESLPPHIPKCAIAGNHDYWLGIQSVKNVLLRQGVKWLEGSRVKWKIGHQEVLLVGNNPSGIIKTKDVLNILCLHQPIDLHLFADHFHLAFAGHLHGSQIVLWEKNGGLYPGRFLYKWNRLSTSTDHCRYFISRGLGDTLPIRYNCPREIVSVCCNPLLLHQTRV